MNGFNMDLSVTDDGAIFSKTPNTLRFGGEEDDVYEWTSRIDHYFALRDVPDEQRLSMVFYHLDGKALMWFQWLETNCLLTTWSDFLIAVKFHFGSSKFEDLEGPTLFSHHHISLSPSAMFHFPHPSAQPPPLPQRLFFHRSAPLSSPKQPPSPVLQSPPPAPSPPKLQLPPPPPVPTPQPPQHQPPTITALCHTPPFPQPLAAPPSLLQPPPPPPTLPPPIPPPPTEPPPDSLHIQAPPHTTHVQPLLQEKFPPDLPPNFTDISHLLGSMTMVPPDLPPLSATSPPIFSSPNPLPPNPPAPQILHGFKPSFPMVEFEFLRADETRFEDVATVGVVSNFYTFPMAIDVLVIAGYHVQLCGEPPPETPLVSFLRLNLTSQVLITGPIKVYIWPNFQEKKSSSSYFLEPNPMGNEGPSPLPQAAYIDPTEFQPLWRQYYHLFQPPTSIKCYHLEDKVVVEEGGNDTPEKPNTSGSSIIEGDGPEENESPKRKKPNSCEDSRMMGKGVVASRKYLSGPNLLRGRESLFHFCC